MKKIVLLGDSIRMGYDKYTKTALDGIAEVYYPEENCRFTAHFLRFVQEWKSKGGWDDDIDLVHWNVGLWDCLELFGDEPLTSMEEYERNIKRLDKRLRMLFPRAKMIFATSTAVIEELYGKDFCRKNSVIEKYNEAAVRALSDTDTVINDLWRVTRELDKSYHSDSTHYYTDKSTALIGGAVLHKICEALGISEKQLTDTRIERENYDSSNIGY